MVTVAERVWPKVDASGDCWEWTGAKVRGYGSLHASGHTLIAHRVVYELLVGPIPAGLTLDHLCRNHACVNPDHLEPVTNKENVLRGQSLAARKARQTHCHRGHEFTPENTAIHGGNRECRACKRAPFRKPGYNRERHRVSNREYRRRRREARLLAA